MSTLNFHSHFSLMEGLDSPEEICITVKERGESCLALTDTNGLYGIPEYLKVAKEYNLKAIVGTEIRFEGFSFVVLVKNRKGYEKLCQFFTSWKLHRKDIRESLRFFIRDKGDLIVFTYHRESLELLNSLEVSELYFSLTPGFFTHRDYLWAKEQGYKVMANNKVHMLSSENFECYKLLRAIAENTTLAEIDVGKYHNKYCYYMGRDEFESFFALYPEALSNSEKIKNDLSSDWFFQGNISPGYNGLSERECDEKLKSLCLERVSARYPDSSEELLEKVYTRLDYEMKIISKKRFSSYFLNVKEITDQCDYTCGRGSSAASIVNYLLEITHVDPIAENLLFDRFMNIERMDPPDIDVDFPSDQRDDVLDFVFEKFKGRAAMVANHNYLRGRSAMREVAKVFGIKEDEISYTLDRLHRITLDSTWEKVHYYACKIEGAIRHLSVHCGGVVITPLPIVMYAPVELSLKGYPVLQWEKDQTELSGLIKTDILGNKGLSVIRDVISSVNKYSEEQLFYKDLHVQDDARTKDIFTTGNTVGVIHFESPRCRTLLKAFKNAKLLTLSIVCSIIRPAAMIQVDEMLRRFHGGKFRYPHPELENILGITKGIMVYQEDVMRVTKALAGFSSQEGNELRKVLAKKHKHKKLKFYQEKFLKGCLEQGISPDDIQILWNDILSFAGYSFCKPHSDSYSLVAFKSAYLKAYYPAEFFAAIITNGGGFYVGNVEDYLNEARRMGVVVLPPDINHSNYEYEGKNLEIRVGLKQIKYLPKSFIKKVLGEREKGVFNSLVDFLDRLAPSISEAKILVKARCFGSIRGVGEEKNSHIELMWKIYEYYARKEGTLSYHQNLPVLSKKLPEFQKEKLISWEYNFLNGFVTFPSWFLYRDLLKEKLIIPASNMYSYLGKEIILYGQKVTQKRVATKYKEHMAFITFSDDTAMFNATFFPRAYEEFRDLLFLGGSYLIKGKVEKDLDDVQVIVSSIQRVGEF